MAFIVTIIATVIVLIDGILVRPRRVGQAASPAYIGCLVIGAAITASTVLGWLIRWYWGLAAFVWLLLVAGIATMIGQCDSDPADGFMQIVEDVFDHIGIAALSLLCGIVALPGLTVFFLCTWTEIRDWITGGMAVGIGLVVLSFIPSTIVFSSNGENYLTSTSNWEKIKSLRGFLGLLLGYVYICAVSVGVALVILGSYALWRDRGQ